RERGPGAGRQPDGRGEGQAADRERQQADRARQALDRQQQKVDREQQRLDRARHSADHLWPPFGPESASDRGTQAYRLMRKQAARDPRGRGRLAKAQTLSRAEIVDAAIAIADAEGADAVSM